MKNLFKPTLFLMMAAISCMAVSCKDEKEEPQKTGDANKEIVGKWQKYGTVESDGSLSGGDPDEFWIFNSDGSFVNEDSGEITTRGSYSVEGNTLTILSREPGSEGKEENFTGTFKIDGQYMDYTFTEIGENDFTTYRFLKQ